MRIGIPTEIRTHETRVGLVPDAVQELVAHGHAVCVQSGAGVAAGFTDDAYVAAGARIVPDAGSAFADAELIVKVKEPQPAEIGRLTSRHTLFTFLHLAADPEQAAGLAASGATAIAYETVTDRSGGLPLLAPMSHIAGRLSVQVGTTLLHAHHGGSGVLLGGVPGTDPGRVVVVGGGAAGGQAARIAAGLRADVTVLDLSMARLAALDDVFDGRVHLRHATRAAVHTAVENADLVIGAVLVPGAAAPKVIPREAVARMRPGSVIVDIAIDQGGCVETIRPTTHDAPTFVAEGVIHYAVTNMPGAVGRTSAAALSAVTLPHVLALAGLGTDAALAADPHLAAGLNVQAGRIVHPAVARALSGKLPMGSLAA